jgi:hypothetical protein
MWALGESFREVSQNVRDDFAVSPLRANQESQQNEIAILSRHG